MRPIRIDITGFRSFRGERETIEWSDEELVAIIGDTGAGKSSILEAITFALYGQTSVSGRQLRELINDDAERMQVALRFWGPDGYVWEAGRETARRNAEREAGPQTAWLQRYGDRGEVLENTEGVRAVNERVARLLGLDHRAFLRTMVLPQGRFAALLASDDQRGRSETLRQIWRSGELDEAAAVVAAARGQAAECCARLKSERAREVADPQAEAKRLGKASAETRRAAEAAARRSERVEELAAQIERHAATAERAGEAARRVERTLASAERKAGAAAEAGTEAAAAERKYAERAAALEKSAGTTEPGETADAGRRLAEIDRRLDAVERLRDAADNARTSEALVRSAAQALETATTAAADAERKLARAQTRRSTADRRQDQAEHTAEAAEAAAVDARREWSDQQAEWVRPLAEARQARAAAAKEVERTARTRDETRTAAEESEREHADAAAELERAAGRSHAHVAAETLAPGEACSVCGQTLPADWQRPSEPDGLAGVRARADETGRRRLTAQGEAATASGAAQAAETALETIDARIRTLEATRDDAGADAGSAETRVAETKRRSEAARRDAAEARETARASREEHEAAARTQADTAAALRGAEIAHGHRKDQAAEAAEACGAAYEAVAADDRPTSDRPAGQAIDRISVKLSVMRAEAAEALARAVEGDKHAAEAARLRTQAAEQRDRRRDAEARLRGARETMAAALDGGPAATPDTEASGAELTALVTRTAEALREGAAAKRAEEAEARRRQADAERSLGAEAEAMGAAPGGTPGPVRRSAGAAAARAAAAAETAAGAEAAFGSRRKLIAELDRRIEEATAVRERLAEAERALKPGGFPKWLTLRRSRTLLRHANIHLERLSRGRYAFVDPEQTREQWMLHDERSGGAAPSGVAVRRRAVPGGAGAEPRNGRDRRSQGRETRELLPRRGLRDARRRGARHGSGGARERSAARPSRRCDHARAASRRPDAARPRCTEHPARRHAHRMARRERARPARGKRPAHRGPVDTVGRTESETASRNHKETSPASSFALRVFSRVAASLLVAGRLSRISGSWIVGPAGRLRRWLAGGQMLVRGPLDCTVGHHEPWAEVQPEGCGM